MNVCIYSNCTGGIITEILRSTFPDWNINYMFLIDVFESKNYQKYHDDLQTCNLFIYQIISDKSSLLNQYVENDKINKKEKKYFTTDYILENILLKDCKSYSYPSFVFKGLHFGLETLKNNIISVNNPWGLFPSGNKYYLEENIEMYFDDIDIIRNFTHSLELVNEYDITDIKLENFLMDTYQYKPILYTYLHPSLEVIQYIITEILNRIEIKKINIKINQNNQIIYDYCNIVEPIHPRVLKALNIKYLESTHKYSMETTFTNEDISRTHVSFDEYIKIYKEYLS